MSFPPFLHLERKAGKAPKPGLPSLLLDRTKPHTIDANISSAEWLRSFGLSGQKLTLEDIRSSIGVTHVEGSERTLAKYIYVYKRRGKRSAGKDA